MIHEEGIALLDCLGGGRRGESSNCEQNKRSSKKRKSKRSSKKSKKSVRAGKDPGAGSPDSDPSSSSSSDPGSSGPNLSLREVAAALIQNINVLSARQLEDKARYRRKASMMSDMGPETEKLFILLLAKDWDKKKPRLNSFMRMLTEDKGMSRAVKIVQSEMKRWDGTVMASGLMQFLSKEYICKNLDNKPGGFTFFMLCLAYIKGQHNSKLDEQSIQETFRDDKLSKETIKYYTKINYNLPSNYEDFLFQLDACYRALELFTCQRGIASEGNHCAHQIMSTDRRRYRPLFTVDPAMGIKIGRFLDNLFQNFCNDLAEFAFEQEPLQKS
jgi:hypothetical protein